MHCLLINTIKLCMSCILQNYKHLNFIYLSNVILSEREEAEEVK